MQVETKAAEPKTTEPLTKETGEDKQRKYTLLVVGFLRWIVGRTSKDQTAGIPKRLKPVFKLWLEIEMIKDEPKTFAQWLTPFLDAYQEKYTECIQIPKSFDFPRNKIEAIFGDGAPHRMRDLCPWIHGQGAKASKGLENLRKLSDGQSLKQTAEMF